MQIPPDGYQFPCVNINGEEPWLRKYFIKAKDIEDAYNILVEAEYKLLALPTKNPYDYEEADSNKENGVGDYYMGQTREILDYQHRL